MMFSLFDKIVIVSIISEWPSYLLNLWMDLVDILPDVRYWSEVLCCTILTHINDLVVKVTDFEILS